MFNRMIHPSPDQVRWTGLAAMVGGALGVVFAPLYSLAYFATADGAADAQLSRGPGMGRPGSGSARSVAHLRLAGRRAGDLLQAVPVHRRWACWPASSGCTPARPSTADGSSGGAFGPASSVCCSSPSARSAGTGRRCSTFTFVAFILPGLLLLVVGSPLFGLGTWRAGVAPRIGALPADHRRPRRAPDQRGRHPRRRPDLALSRLGDPGPLTVVGNADAGSHHPSSTAPSRADRRPA